MRRTNKAVSILLTLTLLLALAPPLGGSARATVGTDWSGTVNVTETETINGCVTVTNDTMLNIDEGVILTVNGSASGAAITVGDGTGTLIVTGQGTLVVNGGNANITHSKVGVDGSLKVIGGTVTVKGGDGLMSGNNSINQPEGSDAITGSLTVEGGTTNVTVTGGKDDWGSRAGVGVHGLTVKGGTVTVTGGNGDGSARNGAGVSGDVNISGGDVTIEGGPISGYDDTGFGVNGGTLTVTGGTVTIKGVRAAGVSLTGNMTVSGGTVEVTGGVAGSNMTVSGGTVTVTGGVADGVRLTDTLKVEGGEVEVTGGSGGWALRDGICCNVILGGGSLKATGGTALYEHGKGVGNDYTVSFDTTTTGLVWFDASNLNINSGNDTTSAKDKLNAGVKLLIGRAAGTWSELYDALQAGGLVVLTNDVKWNTGDGTHKAAILSVELGKTAVLDLNGHTVDRGLANSDAVLYYGYVIDVAGGNLTLNDSGTGGKLTGGNIDGYGGGVYVSGTFTMNGGTISGNKTIHSGGGVFVVGTFTMNGGTISGNVCGTGDDNGGGVSVDSGSTTASFQISGSSVVSGNTRGDAANNVYLPAGKTITVAGTLTGSIGVTAGGAEVGTPVAAKENGALSSADAAKFSYDTDDFIVTLCASGEHAGKAVLAEPAQPPAPTPAPRQSSGGSGYQAQPFSQELASLLAFDGGKVDISPTKAGIGDTVTLTATPDEGMRLASLTVDRVGGDPVELTDKGSNTYSFTMPGWRIAVNAQFEPAAAEQSAAQPVPEAAQAQPTQPAQPTLRAGNLPGVVLSPQRTTVNGAEATVESYNIGGTNYFSLRDLAALLSGTPAQFNVEFDADRDAVVITKGATYNGAVNTSFTDRSDRVVPSYQTVFIDGAPVNLTAYNIGGNNFFGLRELSALLGYSVDYDEANNTAIIESR